MTFQLSTTFFCCIEKVKIHFNTYIKSRKEKNNKVQKINIPTKEDREGQKRVLEVRKRRERRKRNKS